MYEPHPASSQLLVRLFDSKEFDLLKGFARLLSENTSKLDAIWNYDQSLGGLGGYAMPSNPVINPFNT